MREVSARGGLSGAHGAVGARSRLTGPLERLAFVLGASVRALACLERRPALATVAHAPRGAIPARSLGTGGSRHGHRQCEPQRRVRALARGARDDTASNDLHSPASLQPPARRRRSLAVDPVSTFNTTECEGCNWSDAVGDGRNLLPSGRDSRRTESSPSGLRYLCKGHLQPRLGRVHR